MTLKLAFTPLWYSSVFSSC